MGGVCFSLNKPAFYLLLCLQIFCKEARTSNSVAFVHWIPSTFLCMHTKSFQSCPTLCDLMACSPPGSWVHRILQARILKGVAFPFSRISSQLGIKPTPLTSIALAGRFFTTNTTSEAIVFFTQGHNSRNHCYSHCLFFFPFPLFITYFINTYFFIRKNLFIL